MCKTETPISNSKQFRVVSVVQGKPLRAALDLHLNRVRLLQVKSHLVPREAAEIRPDDKLRPSLISSQRFNLQRRKRLHGAVAQDDFPLGLLFHSQQRVRLCKRFRVLLPPVKPAQLSASEVYL